MSPRAHVRGSRAGRTLWSPIGKNAMTRVKEPGQLERQQPWGVHVVTPRLGLRREKAGPTALADNRQNALARIKRRTQSRITAAIRLEPEPVTGERKQTVVQASSRRPRRTPRREKKEKVRSVKQVSRRTAEVHYTYRKVVRVATKGLRRWAKLPAGTVQGMRDSAKARLRRVIMDSSDRTLFTRMSGDRTIGEEIFLGLLWEEVQRWAIENVAPKGASAAVTENYIEAFVTRVVVGYRPAWTLDMARLAIASRDVERSVRKGAAVSQKEALREYTLAWTAQDDAVRLSPRPYTTLPDTALSAHGSDLYDYDSDGAYALSD